MILASLFRLPILQRTILLSSISLGLVLSLSLTSHGADWPRWRGPEADGASAEHDLLDKWPAEGPPMAWQAKGLGSGFSSLAIVGDQIFTMGRSGNESFLICLQRTDGKTLWKAPFGDGEPNCTPTVDGSYVYGLARSGDLACVETASGRIVWQKSFQKDFGGHVPTWGYSESPLVDGELLIATPGSNDAFLVALNKKSGQVVWKTQLAGGDKLQGHGGAGYASPVISHAAGVKQYITLTGKGTVGVDAATGKILWTYDRIANGTANIPTPIVEDNFVLTSSGYGDGGTALLELVKKSGGIEPREVYYFPAKDLQNHHGGMILKDGYVYMGHGHNNGFPLCFEMRTGKDAWRPGRGPGRESAAVAYADGHFYFRYQDATVALVEATPDAYRLKGSFKMAVHNRESWPHPVILDGLMYLRDQDDLVVYDVRKK